LKIIPERNESQREKRKRIKYEKDHKEEDGIVYKWCSFGEHWIIMDDEYFYKATTPDGFHTYCKKCCTKKAMEWAIKNRDKYMEQSRKRNYTPKRIKYLRERSKIQKESGYSAEYIKRPEVKARSKKYNENHRDHDITENEWKSCLKVFENTCAYCGLKYENHIVKLRGKHITMNFHKEHVDDEGYNDLRNCVPACRDCNSSKHKGSLDNWYKIREFFSEERLDKIIWWTTEGYKEHIEDKPPYRVIKKKDAETGKFYHRLWSVDEKRNIIEVLATGIKKKDLDIHIERLFKDVV